MKRVPVLIVGTCGLSGVSTWAEHVRTILAEHPRYDVQLLHIGEGAPPYAIAVDTIAEAFQLIRKMAPVILLPNFVWELYLLGFEPGIACLGMCHADSDEQYYQPLSWYESTIQQFIAVSAECTTRLQERIPLRAADITTLPYGIPIPRPLTRNYRTDPLRIIYAGRVTQLQKRVWDFVPLVEQLLRRGVPFVFDVVGSGDAYVPLRDEMLARYLGKVRFLGRVPYDAMSAIWTGHDVFIQTSDFEGTSVSMLEAMAHGAVPVLTAASSGIEGVINHGENGYVVPVGDMASMAQNIAAIAADRDRLVAMGQAAYQTAQAYALEQYGERFAEVLDRTADSYGQSDLWDRYGMFGGAHPLLRQQQTIEELRQQIAWKDMGHLKRFAAKIKQRRELRKLRRRARARAAVATEVSNDEQRHAA